MTTSAPDYPSTLAYPAGPPEVFAQCSHAHPPHPSSALRLPLRDSNGLSRLAAGPVTADRFRFGP